MNREHELEKALAITEQLWREERARRIKAEAKTSCNPWQRISDWAWPIKRGGSK